MENLRWIAAAALSAYACHLAVHHTTPIDLALPLIAVAVTVCARLSYPAVMVGVVGLVLAEIAVGDEQVRLLVFGVIVAGAVASCLFRAPSDSQLATRNLLVAIICILLLRWLPFEEVLIGRELLLLAVSAATVAVLGRTPFAVAVAVITALVTPAVPMRSHVIPGIVFVLAATARFFGLPRVQLTWPSTMALAFVMLFFPWSGIVARAFPYFLREAQPERHRTVVAQALAPNRSETYEVPEGATQLVVSGANVAHLRRGALLGRVEISRQFAVGSWQGRRSTANCLLPTAYCIPVRIGDCADWGYLRRGAWYRARNPLPRDSAGKVRDYGYSAWVDGAGRIALPRGVRRIRVTADAKLPANASLQVEGFE